MPKHGRVINVSSAAQAPVNLEALTGAGHLSDSQAYAQSKLAITMWSYAMSLSHDQVVVAVNPGSLLGSKMVKEAYGIPGKDMSIGAEILYQAALSSKKFERASGKYFVNDSGDFCQPHPHAMNKMKSQEVVESIEAVPSRLGYNN